MRRSRPLARPTGTRREEPPRGRCRLSQCRPGLRCLLQSAGLEDRKRSRTLHPPLTNVDYGGATRRRSACGRCRAFRSNQDWTMHRVSFAESPASAIAYFPSRLERMSAPRLQRAQPTRQRRAECKIGNSGATAGNAAAARRAGLRGRDVPIGRWRARHARAQARRDQSCKSRRPRAVRPVEWAAATAPIRIAIESQGGSSRPARTAH